MRVRGWRRLVALHCTLEIALEEALRHHDLSVVEYTVLDALHSQDGWHMHMHQLARTAALSSSATTRLVARLERRGLLERQLCTSDRRRVYTELTEAGADLLHRVRPLHDRTLDETLDRAALIDELAPLVEALEKSP
ncbi:MarR family transcriptional regulator [Streptomyces sp. NPDC003077]|uniref:MarR family winged helix-turn-helix transcriptional regulator n=1 Tax=Streptomyces sp. NPDC003077 TaxID=3154443 RepID=UPI0033A070AA